jgi:hypothetical protein
MLQELAFEDVPSVGDGEPSRRVAQVAARGAPGQLDQVAPERVV